MVQPEDIQRKAGRIYAEFLRAFVAGTATAFFPRLVPTERELGGDVAQAVQLVQALRDGSKQIVGYGYSVEWREVNSRTLGRNLFPDRVTFDSADDLVRFVRKEREFAQFSHDVERLKSEFPALSNWVASNIRSVIAAVGDLDGLLAVLRYFVECPRPGCFARELPVSIDTKFIERNERILRQWLDLILPAHAIRADEEHFGLRYGLRYVEQDVFIRFLDANVQRELGFPVQALALPLHTLGALTARDTKVVIVENKVNALTMPSFQRTIVLGGLGNASILLRHVQWLERTPLTYWGDLDVEGLEILSRLRKVFPHTKSIMMGEDSIHQWRPLAGRGTGRKPEVPQHLTDDEMAAFRICVAENFRFEQERVPQSDVVTTFRRLGFV